MHWLAVILVLPFVAALIRVDDSFTGDVTAYSDTWQRGNCGFESLFDKSTSAAVNYFAALNDPQWDSAMHCGRCASVACISPECSSGQAITVMITDRCPECEIGSLDLSNKAFVALTGASQSRFKAKWHFIDCPTTFASGGLEYAIKEGSNSFWLAVQPRNFAQPIATLELKPQGHTEWIQLEPPTSNGIDAFYFLGESTDGFPSGPCQFRAKSIFGAIVVDSFSSLPTTGTVYGDSQFGPPQQPDITTGTPSATTTPSTTYNPLVTETHVEVPKMTPTARSTAPVTATSPPVNTTHPTCDSQIASYETKYGHGTFVLQIYLNDTAPPWKIDARATNIISIETTWNAEAQVFDTEDIRVTPDTSHRYFSGANHIGVLANATDDSRLLSITLSTSDGYVCTIPPVISAEVNIQAATAASSNSTRTGAIAGVSFASLALAGALLMVWRIRHREKEQRHEGSFGGLMTPVDFALGTPVAIL